MRGCCMAVLYLLCVRVWVGDYMNIIYSSMSVCISVLLGWLFNRNASRAGTVRFYTMDLESSELKVWLLRQGLSTPEAAGIVDTAFNR